MPRAQGLAADRRRGMHQSRQLDRLERRGELGADRCGEVLDVRHPRERRLGRSGDPDRVRAQRALDPAHDDRVLLAVAVLAQQPLAEVRIDRRVGTAASRSRERQRAHALAFATHQKLGAGGDQVPSPRPRRRRSTRRTPREGPRTRRRVVVDGRVHLNLAGEHDLLDLACRDHLHGARDRSLVVLGRHRAGDHEASGWRWIEQRQGRRRGAR